MYRNGRDAFPQERDALRRALAVPPASAVSASSTPKPDTVSGRLEAAQQAAAAAELQVRDPDPDPDPDLDQAASVLPRHTRRPW